MNKADLPPENEQRIADARRMIRAAAIYILFAGGIGLLVEPRSGLFTLLIGTAVLTGAWAIRTFKSLLVASFLLLGAVTLLTQRIMTGYHTVTGILVMAGWVVGGVYSVYATIAYHRVQKRRGV